MSTMNRSTTQAHDGQVIAGLKKDLQNVSSLPLGGSTYTMAALEALVQSRIDAANAIAIARANWLESAAKYKSLNTEVELVVRQLRQYVMSTFGTDSPVLADFGFTPLKRATLTSEQLVARAQKAAATRKARGTASKKQKAKIKGTVATTAPTTTPAPSPTGTAAPAPTGTSVTPPGAVVPPAGAAPPKS